MSVDLSEVIQTLQAGTSFDTCQTDTMTDDLNEVIDILREEAGLDTDRYSRSYLRRRVASRMRATDNDIYTDYLEALKDEDELENLVNSLWINVTEFFRNEEVWERVYELLPDTSSVSALSAGCSEGMETYSLSMLTLEKGVDAKIEGVDIDSSVIEKAREGVYEDVDIERLRSLEFLGDPENYIRETEDGYEVTDEVKARTTFYQKDVSDLMESLTFDLVICRNLLIYVDRSDSASIFDSLTSVMDEGSHLVLGKTERLPEEYVDSFETVDSRLRVYRFVG